MHNRRGIVSEKESDYVKVAQARLADYFNGTLKVRPMGKPVYQPTGREKIAQVPDEWQPTAYTPKRLLDREGDE